MAHQFHVSELIASWKVAESDHPSHTGEAGDDND